MTITSQPVDVLVVGGGINGAGIARDAAGRGLSTVLCEQDDLAAHTSSASTKLIHGGLRYLEQFEFGLVRKALQEREVLLRAAPHIIRPLQFVMPHVEGLRPAWMIRAGLMVYDRLARRELLPASHAVSLQKHEAGSSLQSQFDRGFVYADAWVDDARLVVLNAMDAAERGATILTRTVCHAVQRERHRWHAHLRHADGRETRLEARSLVNATGPWAGEFAARTDQAGTPIRLRLVKGSHIIVKRLFRHPHAYIFQHADRRIIFAIPYEDDFTLIGTTDVDHLDRPGRAHITTDEIDYLCAAASSYFRTPVRPEAVVWTYSGVRPLVDEASATASGVTRDYRLVLDLNGPPLLNVFGGKLTTFRKLSEQAIDQVAGALDNTHGAWTRDACLPGGDLFGPAPSNRSVSEFGDWLLKRKQHYAWLAPTLVTRYARTYGSRIEVLLAQRHCVADLGPEILPGLYAAEVAYLMKHEWASCADDILWRRSKLGLHLAADSAARLDAWITTHATEWKTP